MQADEIADADHLRRRLLGDAQFGEARAETGTGCRAQVELGIMTRTAAAISKIMTGWLESPNGNLVRGSACRNTDEFPAAVTAALIGRLMAFPKND